MTLRIACIGWALAGCSMASAQAADVISVSTTLSNFTYQVNDLSDTDGSAAGISFLPAAADGLKFYLGDVQAPGVATSTQSTYNDTTTVLNGSIFGLTSQTVTMPSINAMVAKDGANFTARAAYTASELSDQLATATLSSTVKPIALADQLGDIYLSQNRYANVSFQQPSALLPWSQALKYRLEGNTSVTFTAVIKSEFMTDLTPMIGTEGYTRLLNLPVGGNLHATAVSAVVLDAGVVNQESVKFNHNQYLESSLDVLGNFTSAGRTSPSEQTLTLTLTNNSPFYSEGSIKFSLRNEIKILVRGVPEPGTWATFALGLTGVAWAVRRRRVLQA
jgi:PEP-CTERM motif